MLWILFSLLQPKSIFISHSACFDSTSEKVPFPHPSSFAPCYMAKLVCAFCGLFLLIQQQKFSFEFQIIKTSSVSFFFLDCTNCWRLFYISWLKCTLKKISVFIECNSDCFVNLPFSYIEIKLFSKNKLFCLISITSERENEIPISGRS